MIGRPELVTFCGDNKATSTPKTVKSCCRCCCFITIPIAITTNKQTKTNERQRKKNQDQTKANEQKNEPIQRNILFLEKDGVDATDCFDLLRMGDDLGVTKSYGDEAEAVEEGAEEGGCMWLLFVLTLLVRTKWYSKSTHLSLSSGVFHAKIAFT